MKTIFVVFFIILSITGKANPVSSQLEEVRVFLQGAQITRTAQADIPAGINEIVISGLPVQMDPNSIQLRGQGDFTILSVSHRINHLESPQTSRQLIMLRDSLEQYKNQLDFKQAQLKVYEEEESLLLANKAIGGRESGVNVTDLRAVADFFRSRLQEVKKLQLNTRVEIQKITERYNRVRNQIGQLSSQQNQSVGQIVITTSAQRPVTGKFDFSFITMQAHWQPLYDIRAEETNKPIRMIMKANVYQNTGEDWNNIQLTLSTGSPSQVGQKPNLNPWFLRFVQPTTFKAVSKNAVRMAPVQEFHMVDEETMMDMSISASEFVTPSETQTTIEYHIATPYNIPTGNQKQMVEMQKFEIPATFEYYAIPKLDSEVYLVGKITGWEEFVKLAGEANIFFEGTYVGKTFIDPIAVSDTLDISLGRDRGIVIERNRIKEYSQRGILGRRVTETIAWEINTRNNKKQPVTITIQDQVPVTTDANIQVNLEEKSGARYDENQGILNWKFTIAPAETLKRSFRYTVRYPSDKQLRLE